MYNWSVDIEKLKQHKEKFAMWRLEQMVNFGLHGEKINALELKKYWSRLNLDPARKKFLEFLLHDKRNP